MPKADPLFLPRPRATYVVGLVLDDIVFCALDWRQYQCGCSGDLDWTHMLDVCSRFMCCRSNLEDV